MPSDIAGTSRVFAHSRSDAALFGLALGQGLVLAATAPVEPALHPGWAAAWSAVFAASVWWCSNTISHNHLHNPLFRSRTANRAFSLFLTLLVGIPQTLWKQRHMRHHAGVAASAPRPPGARVLREAAVVGLLWLSMLAVAPWFLLLVYLPGWGLGLALCSLQGHYEHMGGAEGGVSHHGVVHNALWFNDGFHAEHHRWPRMHWSELPAHVIPDAPVDPFPPAARWLSSLRPHILCNLERLALRSSWLQRALVRSHARAFRRVLAGRSPDHVLVVGGGLFPRSVLVLHEVLPHARITVLDASRDHLEVAREHLTSRGMPLDAVDFECGLYDAPNVTRDADLIVLPLALTGDRRSAFQPGPVPRLLHAWLWESRGQASSIVSVLLLKRVSLV